MKGPEFERRSSFAVARGSNSNDNMETILNCNIEQVCRFSENRVPISSLLLYTVNDRSHDNNYYRRYNSLSSFRRSSHSFSSIEIRNLSSAE